MDAIFKRVSVRKYTDEPVSDEQVRQLLRAGMAAPSASNQQPWEFYVVRDKGTLEQLSKVSPYTGMTKDAAVAIAPCIRVEQLKMDLMADQDMGACVENILLEAVELGLGAVWQGVYPIRPLINAVRAILDVPCRLDPFCLIAIGHPAVEPEPTGPGRYDEERIHWE